MGNILARALISGDTRFEGNAGSQRVLRVSRVRVYLAYSILSRRNERLLTFFFEWYTLILTQTRLETPGLQYFCNSYEN